MKWDRRATHGLIAAALAVAGLAAFGARETRGLSLTDLRLGEGLVPHPVRLRRSPALPLSAMARLGAKIFFDPSLSSSGRLACASCHDPRRAYGPPSDLPAMFGGPDLTRQGLRAVPSLMYLDRQPAFSIGPDDAENETVTLAQMAGAAADAARATKTAAAPTQAAANLVPQGGLFWDGRADTLQQQAHAPMTDRLEMDGGGDRRLAGKFAASAYAGDFKALFGPGIFNDNSLMVSEALFALARYQIEDSSFHPYSSKFDFWLEGKARLSPSELRGYQLFNDAKKADCAGCHLDQATADGRPPLFTDHQFEALAAPRNPALLANHDPRYFDLGICGPSRVDMAKETQYCGLFLTPTLRNVATRHVFFHNGVYRTLKQVLDFYNFRDVDPRKIYPVAANGAVEKYDDLPKKYWANVDVIDAPLDRPPGAAPAMSAQDEADLIAFLSTLTDGYQRKTDDRAGK